MGLLFGSNKGNIVLKTPQSAQKLASYKKFCIFISLYHLFLAIYTLVLIWRAVLISIEIDNFDNNLIIFIGLVAFLLVIFSIVLYQLLIKHANYNDGFRTTFILPKHSIIVILLSFFIGRSLYFNQNNKILGGVILGMIIIEIIFIIKTYLFKKQNGLVLEVSK